MLLLRWIGVCCVLAVLLGGRVMAQVPTNQDCDGAIPVCQDTYSQVNSFSGPGNYPNEINGFNSCLASGELNSVWYTFTVQQSGNLCFTISPNNNFDDYDWAVFNLTNANCGDIFTDPTLEVSCNYDPLGGISGDTGPNGSVGVGFEPCIPVLVGETYVVNISNFSSSQFGYTLNFSASTAVIFDNVNPEIDSVVTPVFCGTNTLTFRFTENVLCSTVEDADFLLSGPGGPYTLSGVAGAVCAAGGDQENTYTITVSPPIITPGTYNLALTAASGSVSDLCGNAASPATRTFDLSFIPISAGQDAAITYCETQGLVSLFASIPGSPDVGGNWFAPDGTAFGGTFDPVTDPDGVYTYVIGAAPCPTDSAFLNVSTAPIFSAGTDTNLVVCDSNAINLLTALAGNPDAGGSWTGPGGAAASGTFVLGTDALGTYTYSLPAVGGCAGVSANLTISANPVVNPGTDNSISLCANQGPLDLFLQLGGTPDAGGSWADPLGAASSATYTPGTSLAGIYTYTVVAQAPCPDRSAQVTVTEIPPADPGLSAVISVCDSDDPFTLTDLLGGTPDLGGQWTDGVGNLFGNVFTPGSSFPGTYTYLVTGTAPCANASATLDITINPAPLIALLSQTNIACNGAGTGTISVSGSAGTPPLSYALNGGPLGATTTFSNLLAGTYGILLEDANGCRDSLTVVLSQPSALSASILSQTNMLCAGNPTGAVSLQGTGGTAPYEYALDGVTFGASNTFSGLSSGIYTGTVRDANGCLSTVQVFIIQPEPLLGSVGAQANVDCSGNANGTVSIVGGGGILPYQFSLDGVTFTPNNTFTGFSAGNYTILIQDANGCIGSVPITITEPNPLLATITNQQDVDCFGTNSGSLTGAGSGGVAPYEFSLNGGGFVATPVFNGLSAGFYTYVVRDANGCLATADTVVASPTGLASGIDSLAQVDCFGGNNGWISLFSQGGTGPYQYSIDGVSFSPNADFPGLTAGAYTFFTQDANGCLVSLNTNLTEPAALNLTIDVQTNVACSGDSSGSASVLASGGVGGYEYSLDGITFQPSPDFVNLPMGNYTLSVRDSNNCLTTTPLNITEPFPVDVFIAQQNNVDCFGNSTGFLMAEGSGGTPFYEFALNGGPFSSSLSFPALSQGNYTLYIRDGNLCLDSVSTVISEPDTLLSVIDQQINVDCFGSATGSVSLLSTGGTPAYAYSLDGGPFQGVGLFTDLLAGTYQVSIQDDSSCLADVTVQISEPPVLGLSIGSQSNVDCNGNQTALVQLSVQGGTPLYGFSLDGGVPQSDSLFSGLGVGTYELVVIDDSSCTDTVLVSITEPLPLLAGIDSVLDVACFGNASGAIGIFAQGGTTPYEYSIDGTNFSPDSSFVDLITGNYTITVRDDSACQTTVDVTVNEPPVLGGGITQAVNIDCYANASGWVEVFATGGTQPYEYSLDSLAFQDTVLFEGLLAGDYVLTIRDSQACIFQVPFSLTQPDSLTASFSNVQEVDCFGNANGSFDINAAGGSNPYAFSLDSVSFQAAGTFDNLLAGLYPVWVVDDSSCVIQDTVRINQPDSLAAQISEVQDVLCFGENTGQIGAGGSGGVLPYTFSLDGGTFQASAAFSSLPAGSYVLTIRDANGCQANDSSALILQPDTLTVSTEEIPAICFGEASGTAIALAVGGVAPYLFVWDDPFRQSDAQANNLLAGEYRVRVTDANGCEALVSQVVSQPGAIELSLVAQEDAYCGFLNGQASVAASGGSPAYLYQWNTSPVREGASLNDLASGSYLVTVVDTNGCTDSLRLEIKDTPPASPGFSGSPNLTDTLLLSQASIQFLNTSEGAVAYQWDFGTGGEMSDEENPSFTYEAAGEYEIRLTAFNEFYVCPVDTFLRLVVIPDGKLFFPNAFTPNQDGTNDEYLVKGEGVVSFEMIIFNRWGREVSRLNSLDQTWDGFLSTGGYAPEGVYVFVAKAQLNAGYGIERSGSITLIR